MFKICPIASGSSGNCIYVGSDETHILIDAGVSGKKIKAGLDTLGVDPNRLQGLLVTHEHSDHISGLGVMARRYKVPIYITEITWNRLKDYKQVGKIDEELIRFIKADESIIIGDIEVMPFRTSHDAIDPVCYSFISENKKIGLATDLGVYDDYILSHLKDCHILYIESNHDVSMLQAGGYPYHLKKRILSDIGHLSNETSASLIEAIFHEGLQHIILAHLSSENNHPDIAYITTSNLLNILSKAYNHKTCLTVAKRDTCSESVTIY